MKADKLLKRTVNPWQENGAKSFLKYFKANYRSDIPTVGDIPTTLTHDANTVLNSYTTVSTSTSGKPATNMPSHNISETLAHDASTLTAAIKDLNVPSSTSGNHATITLSHPTAAIKRISTEDICMAMSNIRTSSEDISLNDEDFDPMRIQLVEYELREEFQTRKIEYQKQKILGLENNVKSLTNQHDKILEEISKLKEIMKRMHYENEVLQAKKKLLNYNISTLEKKLEVEK
ncbi:hypothetical protein F8M41_005049 [Gigaspora margarita]|uniref:Uncharacterized protein n=1 Tax=Gigaspora margarita TaxID=4874 RepID=A0A8H4A4Y2_GIGMA|nr:hypothetical protein F8M41_005049 [Gigaspora margarita]